jgi:YD repeat-containing protein
MGRIKEDQLQGLGAVVYEYDGFGRLWKLTHKHLTDAAQDRTVELLYDASGRLQTITDPYNVAIAVLGHDNANRLTSLTEPGGITTGLGYDDHGNVTSVTPPGKPAHALGYSAVDALTQYTPPAAAGVDVAATTYTPTLDGRLDLAVLPKPVGANAVTVDVGYDAFGRAATLTTTNDDVPYSVTIGHALATDPEAGKLRTIVGPDGITLTYGYNQSLHTTTDWTGLVSSTRRVHRDFNDILRVSGESLEDGTGAILPGGDAIAYGYDDDGFLSTAGSLTITRSNSHGLLSSLVLGDLTTSVTSYNSFSEPTSIQTRRGATSFFTENFTAFDKRGRITGRSEVLNLGGGPVTTTWSYEYDDAPGGGGPGRLWKATKGGVTTTYAYDANGTVPLPAGS